MSFPWQYSEWLHEWLIWQEDHAEDLTFVPCNRLAFAAVDVNGRIASLSLTDAGIKVEWSTPDPVTGIRVDFADSWHELEYVLQVGPEAWLIGDLG